MVGTLPVALVLVWASLSPVVRGTATSTVAVMMMNREPAQHLGKQLILTGLLLPEITPAANPDTHANLTILSERHARPTNFRFPVLKAFATEIATLHRLAGNELPVIIEGTVLAPISPTSPYTFEIQTLTLKNANGGLSAHLLEPSLRPIVEVNLPEEVPAVEPTPETAPPVAGEPLPVPSVAEVPSQLLVGIGSVVGVGLFVSVVMLIVRRRRKRHERFGRVEREVQAAHDAATQSPTVGDRLARR